MTGPSCSSYSLESNPHVSDKVKPQMILPVRVVSHEQKRRKNSKMTEI